MKIYTKTGDAGETSLIGGKRVSKSSGRIDAYGTVDELNSLLGVCRSFNTADEIDRILDTIQSDLFRVGAGLASESGKKGPAFERIADKDIRFLEESIDGIEPKLEPLKNFILPGGSRTASLLHFARTISRRAERLVVGVAKTQEVHPEVLIYLNRLSDLLFVLARWVNALSNSSEKPWKA